MALVTEEELSVTHLRQRMIEGLRRRNFAGDNHPVLRVLQNMAKLLTLGGYRVVYKASGISPSQ